MGILDMLVGSPDFFFALPGNPDNIEALGDDYIRVGQTSETLVTALLKHRLPGWRGGEGDMYRELLGGSAEQLRGGVGPHRLVGNELKDFAAVLRRHQHQMAALRTEAEGVRARGNAQRATLALVKAAAALPDATPATKSRAAGLAASVACNEMEWQALVAQADQIRREMQARAAETAARIRNATGQDYDADLLNRTSSVTGPIALDERSLVQQAAETEQGTTGDCVTVAQVIAWIQTHPDQARRQVRWDESSGQYVVTLFDSWQQDPTTGKPLTHEYRVDPGNLDPHHSGAPDGTANIVSIYEAAVWQRMPASKDGVSVGDVTGTLTGHDSLEHKDATGWGEELDSVYFASKAEDGYTVVVGSKQSLPDPPTGPVGKRVLGNHAYVLMGRDAHGKLLLKNPWGGAENRLHVPGELHLSDAEFVAAFDVADIAQAPGE